jgi:hypothetical protein
VTEIITATAAEATSAAATEATNFLQEMLDVTVPALKGNNDSVYNLEEMNDHIQKVMLEPEIQYDQKMEPVHSIVGMARQLMDDPEAQLMAVVALGIGKLIFVSIIVLPFFCRFEQLFIRAS